MNKTTLLPAYSRIHLAPGSFQTQGYSTSGWLPKSGWKLIGAGMEATMLKLVNASAPTAAIGGSGGNFTAALEVSDLTVDCNLSGQGSPADCTGILGFGRDIRIRRLRVINFGTQLPVECFPIIGAFAIPGYGENVNCVVEGCVIEQPALNSNNMVSLILFGSTEYDLTGARAYHRACVVRNCFADCDYRDMPVPITGITVSGGEATVTTALPHNRNTGDWIRISGVLLSGLTNNSFNGSYSITVTNSTQFKYTPKNPTQSGPPDQGGDAWVGRFSSQYVAISGFSEPTGLVSTVTTATPHFLVPGSTVLVSGMDQSAYNGSFVVPANGVPDPYTFKVQVPSDQGQGSGAGYIGILYQGILANSGTAAVAEGNRICNTRIGLYQDTFSTKDLVVRNNHFRGVVIGPYQNMGGFSGPRDCSSLTRSSSGTPPKFIATLTSSFQHGLLVGECVNVSRAFVATIFSPYYNGYFPITSASTFQLTYDLAQDPGGNADASPVPQFGGLWQVGLLVMENNVIELVLNIIPHGSPFGAGIDLYNGKLILPPNFLYREGVFRRNIMHNVDGAFDSSGFPVGVFLQSCGNGMVEENIIDLNSIYTAPPVSQRYSGSVRYFGNQTSGGVSTQGYNVDTGQYVSEVTTDADFALLQSF